MVCCKVRKRVTVLRHRTALETEKSTTTEHEAKIIFHCAHKVLIFLNYPKCDNSLALKHTQQLCAAFPSLGAVATVGMILLFAGEAGSTQ